ncbi:MAG TPA: rhodanese-like domain-containing protein [Thermoanaerobaculia bacterium]|jgi:rhodanese-related sulfurtransferase
MKTRNPFVQVAVMVIAASVIAVVANGFAGRTRKLVLPGYYPNALKVPQKVAPPPSASATTTAPTATSPLTETVLPTLVTDTTATTATTATVAQSPAPGQPPIVIPTATIGRPAGDPAATPAAATPAPAAAPKVDLSKFQPHPDKAAVEISGADAAALHAAGALFLDARRTSVYEAGHIAGSRSFSVWESDIDDKVNNLYNERQDPSEQNKPIVIYCSGGACEDSHMLAQKLWGIQFNNVYVYKDGFPDWQQRGGAVRTGGQP